MVQTSYNLSKNGNRRSIRCCWNYSPVCLRCTALVLILLYCFGIYYCTDIPGSLKKQIENEFGINSRQFEYLYSVAALPNIVLCILGGILTDRVFGLHRSAVLFGSIALIGQGITVLGGFMSIYWIMILGRFIYGVGNSTIEIMCCTYIVLWFQGRELSFVFGLSHSVAKLGTSAVFFIASYLYPYLSEVMPDQTSMHLGINLLPGLILFVVILFCILMLGHLGTVSGKNMGVMTAGDQREIKLKDTITFPISMWLITIILTSIITVVLIFNSMAQSLLKGRYNLDVGEANRLISMFNIIVAAISPFAGYFVDKVGREIFINILGHALAIGALVLFITTNLNPYIFLTLFASSFSTLSSCTWPLISKVVQDHQLSTAYGVVFSAIGLSFTICALYAGYLLDNYDELAVIYFFLAIFIVSCTSVLFLWSWDRTYGEGTLNLSPKQMKRHQSRINLIICKNSNNAQNYNQNAYELTQSQPYPQIMINTLGRIYSLGS